MKYMIITGVITELDKFQDDVNTAIGEGYELKGDLIIIQETADVGFSVLQAMIKSKKEEKVRPMMGDSKK